jgi:ribosomal protein S27AE
MLNCPRCREELVAGGAVYGPGRMAFRPQDSKFFTLQTGDVMTKAMMCRECGVIELVGDVAKLKRLLSGTDAPPGAGPSRET